MDTSPPDYASPVGQIRSLTSDTEQYDYDQNGTLRYRQSDDVLQSFLAISRDKFYSAAALALMALASNEVLVSKVIRSEDLQTNGAAVAAELRLEAQRYLQMQKDEDSEAAYEDAFLIVDHGYPYTPLEG